MALSDPWDCPEPPCVPDNITLESYKFAVRARGSGAIGSGGVGYIAVNPYNPYIYSSTNNVCGFVTGSGFAGTTFSDPTVGGVSQIATDATMPYTNADNYDQAYRVVGAGLKVQYTGNVMNQQGLFVIARDPSNSPFVGGTTIPALLLFRETTQLRVDQNWHCVLWKPATASDITYAPRGIDIDGTMLTGTKLFNTNPTMGIFITGGTAGASFEYDFIVWFEMTGRTLPSISTSHSDPIGMSAVSAAVSSHQPETTPANNAIAFGQSVDQKIESFSFLDSVASVASSIMPLVAEAAPYIMAMV